MEHDIEAVRRGAKAYNLCLAFERKCKKVDRRMTKKIMITHAELMEQPFWDRLAQEAGIRTPSPETVATTIGILNSRAIPPA